MPQLNVFAVGFPAKVAVGLLLIGASMPFVAGWISDQLQGERRRRPSQTLKGRLSAMARRRCATRPRRQRPRGATRRARRGRSPSRTTSTAPCPAGRPVRARLAGAAIAQRRRRPRCAPALRPIADPARSGRAADRRSCMLIAVRRRAAGARADRRRLRGRRVVVNLLQVGFKPDAAALKPDFKRLNPLAGFKNIFGTTRSSRPARTSSRCASSARSSRSRVLPQLRSSARSSACRRCALARRARARRSCASPSAPRSPTSLIGVVDFVYQRHRHEKALRMDKQEVKDESKQQTSPQEVKRALRRRQREAARAAHDGRRPDGRRRRHQPDALRRRPALRRRQGRARGRRQGQGPRRRCASASSPREPASRSSPTRRSRARCTRSVEVGQHDPRRALPGRRAACWPTSTASPAAERPPRWTTHEAPAQKSSTPTCSPPARSCWSW